MGCKYCKPSVSPKVVLEGRSVVVPDTDLIQGDEPVLILNPDSIISVNEEQLIRDITPSLLPIAKENQLHREVPLLPSTEQPLIENLSIRELTNLSTDELPGSFTGHKAKVPSVSPPPTEVPTPVAVEQIVPERSLTETRSHFNAKAIPNVPKGVSESTWSKVPSLKLTKQSSLGPQADSASPRMTTQHPATARLSPRLVPVKTSFTVSSLSMNVSPQKKTGVKIELVEAEEDVDAERERAEKDNQLALQFMETWVTLLEHMAEDLIIWNDQEQLLKAHIMLRIIKEDLVLSEAIICAATKQADPSVAAQEWRQRKQAAQSSIMTSEDEELPGHNGLDNNTNGQVKSLTATPLVLSLLPLDSLPDSASDLPGLCLFFGDNAAKEVLNMYLTRIQTLRKQTDEGALTKMITEKWNYFASVMSIFGITKRFNFDLPVHSLLSAKSREVWEHGMAEIIRLSYRSMQPVAEYVKIASQHRLCSETSGINDAQAMPSPREIATTASGDMPAKRRRSSLRRSMSRLRHPTFRYRRQQSINKEKGEQPWTEESRKGVLLAYRLHGDGMVSAKIRARICCPFAHILAVLDDLPQYHKWVPYCVKSELYKTFSTCSYLLGYTADMPWPIRKKETIAYCSGVDALEELGQAVVFLTSPLVGDGSVLGHPIPPPGKVPRIDRSHITFFLTPIATDMTAMEVYAKIDPGINTKMLRGIIPWVVKNTVLDFFGKVATLAHKTDPAYFAQLPHHTFYMHLHGRAEQFVLNKTSTTKLNNADQAVGFDDNDLQWFRKIQTFKMD